MKLFLPFFSLFLVAGFSLYAQPQCTGSGRYVDSTFTCVEKTQNIKYGTALRDWYWDNLLCLNVNLPPYQQTGLYCDFYEPCQDTLTERPLVVLIHGGAWAGGSKNDMAAFADLLARQGYAVAAINYRLSLPANALCWDVDVDSIRLWRAAFRAVQDANTAVRYFRQNAAEYRIHPDYIFAVGVSAGGFTALGVGYLDQESERPAVCGLQPQYGQWLGQYRAPDLGSIAGSGGDTAVSHAVRAVVSASGAVFDTTWFDGPSDPPFLQFHGTLDDVVPYGYDCLVEGLINANIFHKCIRVFGPEAFVPAAQQAGTPANLTTFQNGTHSYTPVELDILLSQTSEFLCAQMPVITGLSDDPDMADLVAVFPNPADGLCRVQCRQACLFRLVDSQGRVCLSEMLPPGQTTVDVSRFPSGLYYWEGAGNRGKLLIVR